MKVDLYQCGRCGLLFVPPEGYKNCPRCERHFSGQVKLILADRNVEVGEVRIVKARKIEKKGLESIDLGCRCPHNYLHPALCNQC